jgi:hypothetical protein
MLIQKDKKDSADSDHKLLNLTSVPNRRRTEHVHVVVVSKCSHVWMGGGKVDVWGQERG